MQCRLLDDGDARDPLYSSLNETTEMQCSLHPTPTHRFTNCVHRTKIHSCFTILHMQVN